MDRKGKYVPGPPVPVAHQPAVLIMKRLVAKIRKNRYGDMTIQK
jgi:hypothetical protein